MLTWPEKVGAFSNFLEKSHGAEKGATPTSVLEVGGYPLTKLKFRKNSHRSKKCSTKYFKVLRLKQLFG